VDDVSNGAWRHTQRARDVCLAETSALELIRDVEWIHGDDGADEE